MSDSKDPNTKPVGDPGSSSAYGDDLDHEALWASVPAGDVKLGDRVRLRKEHPCGGFDWEVVRLGADIGLVCLTCGRKVFLSRRDLARRMKMRLPRE